MKHNQKCPNILLSYIKKIYMNVLKSEKMNYHEYLKHFTNEADFFLYIVIITMIVLTSTRQLFLSLQLKSEAKDYQIFITFFL